MEQLLARYFSGEATNEEEKKILQWRTENPDNARTFHEAKIAWCESHPVDPNKQFLNSMLDTSGDGFQFRHYYRYAAILVLGLAAVMTIFLLNRDREVSSLVSSDSLSDGSEIVMYKDASVEVLDFKEKREVQVNGKVYFDVASDQNKPFVIWTKEAIIEVIGTSFIVDASQEGITEVLVESGMVSLKRNSGRSVKIELTPGEKGIVHPNAKGLIKRRIEDANYLSWVNGIMRFRSSEMGDVADKLTEVYGYEVLFSNSDLKACKLTAKFQNKSVEEITEIIASTFGFNYELSENQIVFNGQACN